MHKAKTASFEVDCQKTFTPLCPGELPVPGGHEIVSELNAQAAYANYRLGCKDAHSPNAIWVDADKNAQAFENHPQIDRYWKKHAIPGTLGFESLDGLPPPAAYDYFVWKGVELDLHPYGGCYHDAAQKVSTGAIEFLKYNGIDTVIVGGLALDYCVKQTVLELRQAGFTVIVNLGASRGLASDTIAAALAEMRGRGVQIIESSTELAGL